MSEVVAVTSLRLSEPDIGSAKLRHRLLLATARDLSRGMHYPASWAPSFRGYMMLGELYRYPSQHFELHRRQLTFGSSAR